MRLLRIFAPSFAASKFWGFAVFLVLAGASFFLRAAPQSSSHRQELHSVLSHVILNPPLRSPQASLRYSPDGKYLMVQDPTGVTVLLEKPLKILLHIAAENVYPAQFSANSQQLVLVSRGLTFAKWKLPEGEKVAKGDLPSKEGCMDAALSPGGEFFACFTPDFHFALYELATQKPVFEDAFGPPGVSYSGSLRTFYETPAIFFSPIDIDSAFSGPFGIVRTSEPRPNPNRSFLASSIHFSPDARTLIAGWLKSPLGVDIAERKKFELPGPVQKVIHGAVALQTSERLIAIEPGKGTLQESAATVLSLKNGNVLATFPLSARRLEMASNPRFVTLYNFSPDGQSATAFDLEESRTLDTPPAVTLDAYGEELAVYTVNGSVALYRLGQRSLVANLPLPLSTLPLPHCVLLTPDLDKLALSIEGVGAIFDLGSGRRVATFPRFSAANFLGGQEASLFFPRFGEDPPRISRVNTSSGAVTPSWEIGKDQQLRSGGPILLEYSFDKQAMGRPWELMELEMEVPYDLRALDPATGKELWARQFKNNPPTPFADPQGERLVLGWKAKTSEGKTAASRNPATREIFKSAKLTEHDSYFEALDARSGNSAGGVLVMAGNGPTAFDAAFAVADTMILLKDGTRVSLYSLRDGQLKAHLVGARPAATAASNLLALYLGEGRLGIFDLSSGAKLDEQLFPDGLSYTHFSADGKRLFVLTEHQSAVVLDVSEVRKPRGPNSEGNPENN